MNWAEERIKDIKEHPGDHRHTYEKLQACCTKGGVIYMEVMDAHSKYVNLGTNGGVKCDTTEGPCSCGGWH